MVVGARTVSCKLHALQHTIPAAGECASGLMCLTQAPEEVGRVLVWSRGGLGRDDTHVSVDPRERTCGPGPRVVVRHD